MTIPARFSPLPSRRDGSLSSPSPGGTFPRAGRPYAWRRPKGVIFLDHDDDDRDAANNADNCEHIRTDPPPQPAPCRHMASRPPDADNFS